MENQHIYNAETYPNLLESIHLDSDTIKTQIENYKLQFIQVRNQQVEWGIRFPMFVYSFYRFVIQNNIIPNQQEFYDYYILENRALFQEKGFSEDIMYGLRARVFRTYPSIVRDVYFNKYVEENSEEYNIVYNLRLDVEEGIDLMISDVDRNWGVCLYTNTNRALIGRNAKQYRHCQFINVNYIEFPVNFKGSTQVGDFFLYGNREYNDLIKRLT